MTIINATNDQLMPLIAELLENKQTVKITATGRSMLPFLRPERDAVELENRSYETIRPLDMVLIQRQDGQYILHRVIKISSVEFYLVGDAQRIIEGPLRPDQVIGVVKTVWWKGHEINPRSKGYLMLAWLWMQCLPCRHLLLRIGGKVKRVVKW